MSVDFKMAREHINALCMWQDPHVTLQSFDDSPKKDPSLAAVMHDQLVNLWPWVCKQQDQGAGIYVTVNETDGLGRKAKNITAIRAVCADKDDGLFTHIPLSPTITVTTRNGQHCYWVLKDRDITPEEYPLIQEGAAVVLGSDRAVKDVARVLRLAGTLHLKDPDNPFPVRLTDFNPDALYTRDQIVSFFPPVERKEVVPVGTYASRSSWSDDREKIFNRVKQYLLKMPPSVQGSQGSRDAFVAAAKAAKTLGVEEGYQAFMESYNAFNCSPPWSPQEARRKVEEGYRARDIAPIDLDRDPPMLRKSSANAAQTRPPTEKEREELPRHRGLTDKGNIERFVDAYGEDVCFLPEGNSLGKWAAWDGKLWTRPQSDAGREYAMRLFGDVMTAEADEILKNNYRVVCFGEQVVDKHPANALRAHQKASQSWGRICSVATGVRVFLSRKLSDFDQDDWIISTPDQTIDLRSCEPRPPRREDMCTLASPTRYNPDAKCPLWENFLQEITEGNDDLVRFLQRVAGYCLTGDTSEQKVFIMYGRGSNGKSTFLNTIMSVIGDDFCKSVDPASFAADSASKHEERLAMLKGVRMVSAIEATASRGLDESTIKQISGGDKISARHLYGDRFEFLPKLKMFFSCNDPIRIKGTDDGIWRRICQIPFNRRFMGKERDLQLKYKLLDESEGILLWLLDGCREWQRVGLDIPEIVTSATEDYRSESDWFGSFVEDAIKETHESVFLSNKRLMRAYKQWCDESGADSKKSSRFLTMELKKRGFKYRKTSHSRGFAGITLQDAYDVADNLPF